MQTIAAVSLAGGQGKTTTCYFLVKIVRYFYCVMLTFFFRPLISAPPVYSAPDGGGGHINYPLPPPIYHQKKNGFWFSVVVFLIKFTKSISKLTIFYLISALEKVFHHCLRRNEGLYTGFNWLVNSVYCGLK